MLCSAYIHLDPQGQNKIKHHKVRCSHKEKKPCTRCLAVQSLSSRHPIIWHACLGTDNSSADPG